MTDTDQSTQSQLGDLVVAIELELKQLGLWSEKKPSAMALRSQVPFAADQMTFEQWLQFKFLPQIQQMIAANQSLSFRSNILPMAQHSFQQHGASVKRLLNLIQTFDELSIIMTIQTTDE